MEKKRRRNCWFYFWHCYSCVFELKLEGNLFRSWRSCGVIVTMRLPAGTTSKGTLLSPFSLRSRSSKTHSLSSLFSRWLSLSSWWWWSCYPWNAFSYHCAASLSLLPSTSLSHFTFNCNVSPWKSLPPPNKRRPDPPPASVITFPQGSMKMYAHVDIFGGSPKPKVFVRTHLVVKFSCCLADGYLSITTVTLEGIGNLLDESLGESFRFRSQAISFNSFIQTWRKKAAGSSKRLSSLETNSIKRQRKSFGTNTSHYYCYQKRNLSHG